MKVILNEYVANLGDRGAACEVRPGYGRNFLIPKGLAYLATTANRARFKQEQKQWDVEEAREKGSAEALASRLAGIELSFDVEQSGHEHDGRWGSAARQGPERRESPLRQDDFLSRGRHADHGPGLWHRPRRIQPG